MEADEPGVHGGASEVGTSDNGPHQNSNDRGSHQILNFSDNVIWYQMDSGGTIGVGWSRMIHHWMVSDLLYFQGWMRAIQGGVPENNFWVSGRRLPPFKIFRFSIELRLGKSSFKSLIFK